MLQPLGPRIAVKLDDPISASRGGIALPQTAQKPPGFGTVVAVGSWEQDYPEITLMVGDHVLVNKYGGQTVRYNEEDIQILHVFNDVLAIERKGQE